MLKRIVKLTFHPQLVPEFLALFEDTKDRIRHFPGCLHLELLQEAGRPDVFFTFSIWQDEAALNAYRDSELFQDTWARTKALFRDKPEAWSLEYRFRSS
ncbi:MAG: antibiotic biosynthesis monooxygenase [Saprospirales bacterium]|nr:antibiotic biosynthesis monooxygenase [Saprospirales bacterium]